MRLSHASIASLTLVISSLVNAIKTSIYIDQVPLYSSLAGCAQDRLSAIVRAQSSGCGDSQQLTSFSCFCIDQSSMMSSIISTAVQASCMPYATATVISVLPQVTSALDVFSSYCSRNTELAWYKDNATIPTTVTITEAPSSIPASAAISSATASSTFSQGSNKRVPIAAIAAPVVVGFIAIALVIGLLFWLRRRRGIKKAEKALPMDTASPGLFGNRFSRNELDEDTRVAGEMQAEKYRHELENHEVNERVELDGAHVHAGSGYAAEKGT